MVTMEDIAIALGCSINTVSKALNNKPDVSQKTRQLVVETAKKMGYIPNSLAKSLVTKTSGTIGIVIPSLAISIYTDVVEAIMERASKVSYSTFLAISSNDPEAETAAIENLFQKRVDSLIVIPVDKHPEYQKTLNIFNTPIVYIMSDIDSPDSVFVGIDLKDCAVRITNHLYDSGARRLSLVCSTRTGMTTDVIRGFCEVMRSKGVENPEKDIYQPLTSMTPQDAGFEIAHMLDRNIEEYDGIVLEHELLYFGIHDLLEHHGLSCPDDILAAACIGVDNRHGTTQSLTSIDFSPKQIGYDALSLVMDMIHYQRDAAVKKLKEYPKLIVRKSSKRKNFGRGRAE